MDGHSSPVVSKFWSENDTSLFKEEARQLRKGESALKRRMTEIWEDGEFRRINWEGCRIRHQIKVATEWSTEWRINHKGELPVNPGIPRVLEDLPDHGKSSNTQKLLRRLEVDIFRPSDLPVLRQFRHPLPTRSTALQSPAQIRCQICSDFRDPYGKTYWYVLRKTAKRCASCKLVVDALSVYETNVQQSDKVRILAPLVPGPTLRLFCGDFNSPLSKIPFMIELFASQGTARFTRTPLLTVLTTTSGKPSPWSSIVPANGISGDTSSPQAFAQVRRWLDSCIQYHKRCGIRSKTCPALPPTRLVEIGFDGDLTHTRLVTNEFLCRYACLSHCWGQGSPGPFRTVQNNYHEHLRVIPWWSLSETFRDAIVAAWRLDIRYIWIDSLCILQDDASDWLVEAAKMGSYYENAYITIASSWSPGPGGGCFVLADPEFLERPLRFGNPLLKRYTIYSRRTIGHGLGWPLLARAWVYQERLLSRRVLHFGPTELVWECLSETTCECGLYDNLQSTISSKTDHARIMSSESSLVILASKWRDMVEQYTKLDLTKQADRLPAIAGLAKQMQRYRNSNYFLGLWEDSLIGDLLWMPVWNIQLQRGSFPRPCTNNVPTWSWASFSGFGITYRELGKRTTQYRREICCDRTAVTYSKLLSTTCTPLAEGNSGDGGGYIALQGPIIQGLVQHVLSPRGPWLNDDLREQDTSDKVMESKLSVPGRTIDSLIFYPDYNLFLEGRHHLESNTNVTLMKMVLVREEFGGGYVIYLVLRRVATFTETYERIGLAQWSYDWDDPQDIVPDCGNESVVVRIV
jgi:hypothetical protein